MSVRDRLSSPHIAALESVSQAFSADRWVLLGATAIHCRIELPRSTADVDFAVAANVLSAAERLEQAGWKGSQGNRHRWTRNHSRIDVIPVTRQDIDAGEVDLGDGLVMSVAGFDLAYDQAEGVSLGDDLVILVPRLPVLVLLKMISWLDRPNVRTKDLGDLMFMIDATLPEDDARRWEPPLSEIELDFEDQSAFAAGSELGRIVQKAHQHWVRVFLDKMRDDDSVEFATLLRVSRFGGAAPEWRLRRRLTAFESGFEHGLESQSHEPRPLAPVFAGELKTSERQARRSSELILHEAIEKRRLVRFRYQGLERVAEPHVLGIKNGRLHILAWQTGGRSRSRPFPGWRRFRIGGMSELQITEQSFAGRRRTRGKPSAFDRHIAVVR